MSKHDESELNQTPLDGTGDPLIAMLRNKQPAAGGLDDAALLFEMGRTAESQKWHRFTVYAGLLCIAATLCIATLLTNQNRQITALTAKLEATDQTAPTKLASNIDVPIVEQLEPRRQKIDEADSAPGHENDKSNRGEMLPNNEYLATDGFASEMQLFMQQDRQRRMSPILKRHLQQLRQEDWRYEKPIARAAEPFNEPKLPTVLELQREFNRQWNNSERKGTKRKV